MRSSGTTKSTSQLPSHVSPTPNSTNHQQQQSSRKALSASISTAALLHASEPPGNREKPAFAITDLLESPSGDVNKSYRNQQQQSPAMDTAALLPLSPIKHSSTNLQQSVPAPHQSPKTFNISAGTSESQQQNPKQAQYLQRLDDPENVELFAYASTLCHRITGRYLPKALLQNDAEAQKREIERMQRDPEIVKAIATIRVRYVFCLRAQCISSLVMSHPGQLGGLLLLCLNDDLDAVQAV